MDSLPKKKELVEAILFIMEKESRIMTTKEIDAKVAIMLEIPQELLELEDANCTGSEYSYRMRWARTELKKKDSIFSPRRGEWQITGC